MSTPHGQAIARAFAAASEYDRHARVQRLVARQLAHRIAALPLQRSLRVLEIGCGTGFLAEALREQGLTGDWLLTDLSPAMLERARARLGPACTYARLDGERETPVPAGPFDLICASLATQWFTKEATALARWREWLAPDGHIVVSTLGPATFAQWRTAHEQEGLVPGTPAFTSVADLQAIAPVDLTVERYHERHGDARAFLQALRGIGAGTAIAAHRPLSAAALRRVMRRFEAGGAVATYEVVTCHLTQAIEAA